jgi:hypothetical protein
MPLEPAVIEDSAKFRQRAQRCTDMAQCAKNENDWLAMMRLATHWAILADEVERTPLRAEN